MKREVLDKYLKNECTLKELEEVVAWIKSGNRLSDIDNGVRQEWTKTSGADTKYNNEHFHNILDKIHHRINIEEDYKKPGNLKSNPVLSWVTRVAAILLLPVTLFLGYTLSKDSNEASDFYAAVQNDTLEVVAPVGSQTNFILSDGSKVFLNNGSKIRYPFHFSKDKREVLLIGEAYFEVAHDKAKPFIVKTQFMNVKALGTEFNVHAYLDENTVSTTLVEGKVAIEKIPSTGEIVYVGEMIPNQHISYDMVNNKVKSSFGEIEKYVSWKEGKLIFKNDNIEQITNRLSRWYNVDIEIIDERVKGFTYTATFIDETLIQILDLLELATPINYTVEPRRKLAEGTFTKQKVIIGYKN